jgi:hypothetical protein
MNFIFVSPLLGRLQWRLCREVGAKGAFSTSISKSFLNFGRRSYGPPAHGPVICLASRKIADAVVVFEIRTVLRSVTNPGRRTAME